MSVILLYHRVAELASDPQRLAVTPTRFCEHLKAIAGHGSPMSLGEMLDAVRARRLPARAVAVTFDDGYADNLYCAKPLLARYGIPATVFIATGYTGGQREFWWDDLERLLLLPGRLPETLRLQVGTRVHEWFLGDAALYSEERCRRHAEWNVEIEADPSPRHRVYRELCRLMRGLPGDRRADALDELSSLAGVTTAGRATHRPLSHDELARLGAGGTVRIGAHTMAHSALADLSIDAQRLEITRSKALLEEWTGGRVDGFAYPFGGRADYTKATVSLVRDAGFAWACANVAGEVRHRSDPWQLPRVLVRNWEADTFADRLGEWLG